MIHYTLDEAGEVVTTDDVLKWARWFESADRQVKRDTIDGVVVSTVFLGIDHNFVGSGRPILWETMVFGGKLDEGAMRYFSKEDALRGHAEMVSRVRRTEMVLVK